MKSYFMGIIEYLKMVRATPVWDRVPAISDTELDAMIDILQKNKSINGVLILKCEECNGTGYVAIAPGVRGIRKCSMCNGTGEITTIPPSQTKGEHRAAKISEIIRDLQEIQEKYGDVRVYVNPWAEAVNRHVIAAKSSFVDEAGSIQAVIIA